MDKYRCFSVRKLWMTIAFFVFSNTSRADDLNSLDRVCSGLPKGKLVLNDISVATENGCFPRFNDQITTLIKRCDQYKNGIASVRAVSYQIREISDPQSPLNLAADLTEKIKELSKKEALKFKEGYALNERCALQMQDNKPVTLDCADFRNKLVPMINDRLKVMRQLLAATLIEKKEFRPSESFQHTFLPKSETIEILPLTDEELLKLKEGTAGGIPKNIQKRYLELMSTYPVLLNFHGHVATPGELVKAFKMPSHFDNDFKDLDYPMMNARLLAVLSEIPIEKRGDYCLVAKKLREASGGQQEASRAVINTLGFAGGTSIIRALLYVTGFSFADSSLESSEASDRLDRNLKLCFASPLKSPSCNFENLQRDFDKVKDSSIYLPLFGPPSSLKKAKEI